MAHESTVTVRATLETREAADTAVEPLVQQSGMARPGIFHPFRQIARPTTRRRRAGMARMPKVRSGDAPLDGENEMSADIASSQVAAIRRSLADDRDCGCQTVEKHAGADVLFVRRRS